MTFLTTNSSERVLLALILCAAAFVRLYDLSLMNSGHRARVCAQQLIVSLLGCLTMSSAMHAAEWLPAVRLTPAGVSGWFPDVSADLAGGVHVVWSSGPGRTGDDAVIYCPATVEGCTETTAIALRPASDGNYVTRPAPAVDRSGIFHLLWRRKGLICYTAAPVMRALLPMSWERLRKIGEGSYTALAMDDRGSLHAAWSQPVFRYPGGPCAEHPCYGCADIFYSRSDDGGQVWTLPVNVSQTPDGSEKPHIAFAKDGTLYIAWEEGRDQYVGRGELQSSMLSTSTDGGSSWRAPATFSFPGDSPQSIAVGVDGQDRVVVVWQLVGGDGVFSQTSSDHGQSWSTPEPIAGVLRRPLRNKLDDYDIAADPTGNLHLVLSGRLSPNDDGKAHVLHLEWDGHHWSAPTPVGTSDGAPEWPHIAVGNGNQLHVVWFERPAGFEWKTDANNYAVWYARGTTNAPATAPIVWPAPKPEILTTDQLLRLAQAVLAVAMVLTVIITARRFGW